MVMNRRTMLLGAAAAVGLSCKADGQATSGDARPEDFGARGDGRSDDTRAIQACIDSAGNGGTLVLRRGAVYLVDTNFTPTFQEFGGLKLRSGQTLRLNGAELRALPSARPGGSVVQISRADNVRILGPGRVTGERSAHRGSGGEWGMGISAFSANSFLIREVEIANCWGDGLYIGHWGDHPGSFCQQWLVEGVRISNCRRNGISVVAGRDGEIRSVTILQIRGTPPQAGIDLEPDSASHPNRDLRILNATIRSAELGIAVTVGNERVLIQGSDIEGANAGIAIGDNARGIRVLGNPRIASTRGGSEGGAVRTVATNTATISDIEVRGNTLVGGGAFVVDFAVPGYRNVEIAQNRIRASNPGVFGFARMVGGGTFVGNECVLEAGSGMPGQFFVQLAGVRHGRNVYNSRSSPRMYALLPGSTEIAADIYASPRLTRSP
jgi:polygalacturonase